MSGSSKRMKAEARTRRQGEGATRGFLDPVVPRYIRRGHDAIALGQFGKHFRRAFERHAMAVTLLEGQHGKHLIADAK